MWCVGGGGFLNEEEGLSAEGGNEVRRWAWKGDVGLAECRAEGGGGGSVSKWRVLQGGVFFREECFFLQKKTTYSSLFGKQLLG